jgi:hypothetical protein
MPVSRYPGDPAEAFWCFDEEMARATEAYHARSDGKQPQQVDFMQAGILASISTTHAGVELKFLPEADGVTFRLTGDFIVPLPKNPPVAAKDTGKLPPPTIHHPQKAGPGLHASGAVSVSPIVGPVEQLAPDTFRVAFNRTFSTTDKRDHDIWFLAHHPGDRNFKGAVQQALLRVPRFTEGASQVIAFPVIPNQKRGTEPIRLEASSDAGEPVGYYVREGPAVVRDGMLHLTPLPPRAKLPLKITVVAWQLGRGTAPGIRAAMPVEQSFLLEAP